ncbi:MAG TPA: hypothetical protein VJ818_06855, partial [Actinomycetota bacterium]|nr:hypothetical protein [Actinomycetota bacterium]
DAGQLWAVRRNAITGTDGAALAQAQYYAKNHPAVGTTACITGVWDTVLQNNVGELINQSCQVKNVTSNGGAGVVIVTALRRSDAIFSGALGIGSSAAYSMSAAMWGYSTKPLGIRPIMLCVNDPQVQDALNIGGEAAVASPNYNAPDNSTDYAGRTPGVVHHLVYNSSSNACGGVSGNWGWVNLSNYWTGSSNTNPGNNTSQLDQGCQDPSTLSAQELSQCGLSDWLEYGWNDEVQLPQPTPTPTPTATIAADCDTSKGTSSDTCNGITGAKGDNQVLNALEYLMNPTAPVSKGTDCSSGKVACQPATIPIILYGTPTAGNGSGGQFTLSTIAMVKIWGFDMTGGNGNSPPYLDLEFMNAIVSGGCCSSSTSNNAPPSVRICDVDHDSKDPSGTAARCVFS